MYCTSCGKELPEGVRFCGFCGSAVGVPASGKSFTGGGESSAGQAPAGHAVHEPGPYRYAQAAALAPVEDIGKWPAGAGVFAVIALVLSVLRPAVMLAIMRYMYGSGNYHIGMSGFAVNIAAALFLAVLLLAHTKRIPWLTAIPRTAVLLMSLFSLVQTITNYGAPMAPYMIFGSYLPLLISLVMLVLYWIFTIQRKVPAAFAVIVLVLAILSFLISLINLATEAASRDMPSFVLSNNLLGTVMGMVSEIAYVIVLFALRKKLEPGNPAQNYGVSAYGNQPVGNGYVQPLVAPRPYVPQNTYDAPSGGYAVLGFFIPIVGLILYLVWKDETPLRAKSAGKGALIGVITGVVLSVVLTVISVAINASILASLY